MLISTSWCLFGSIVLELIYFNAKVSSSGLLMKWIKRYLIGPRITLYWNQGSGSPCIGTRALTIDKLVKLDRSKMKKCVRYFGYGAGRILGGSWSTNNPYWLKHIRIVLPTNTKVVANSGRQMADWFLHPNTIFRSYSFSPGYVGEYKCTLVGLGLLVCLWPWQEPKQFKFVSGSGTCPYRKYTNQQ